MTMVAMLRTIAYAWRQDALATNAQQVLTLGKELHGRLAVMGSHLAKLGRQLQSAADSYNRTVGSLETRVLVSARRFADLHVVDDELTTPPTVNPQLSAVSAPELLASVNESVVAIDERPDDRDEPRREPSAGGASERRSPWPTDVKAPAQGVRRAARRARCGRRGRGARRRPSSP